MPNDKCICCNENFLLIEMKIKNVNEERISQIDTDVELNVNMKSETFI